MCFGCGDINKDSMVNAGCELRLQENCSVYKYDTDFFSPISANECNFLLLYHNQLWYLWVICNY